MMGSQKEVFLSSEGDAWFLRNRQDLNAYEWERDPVCQAIESCVGSTPNKILEIGCGNGARLEYLAKRYGHSVAGIDPSAQAVSDAIKRGVSASCSTAEKLPFDRGSFDVVVFGFCLYLCDDEDLFAIAFEADRVLSATGWLFILDFDSPSPVYKPYHHREGVKSRKMDYKSMFLWHPSYTLAAWRKFHHKSHEWTDERDQWVSLSSVRKLRQVE